MGNCPPSYSEVVAIQRVGTEWAERLITPPFILTAIAAKIWLSNDFLFLFAHLDF